MAIVLLAMALTGVYVFVGLAGFVMAGMLRLPNWVTVAVGVAWPLAFPLLLVVALNELSEDD